MFTAALGLSYVALAAGAFLSQGRLWGIDHLSYYPVPVRIGVLVLLGASFVRPLGRRLYRAMLAAASIPRRRSTLPILGVAAAALVMFSAFHSATYLLGDGQTQANELTDVVESDKISLGRSLRAVFKNEHISPMAWSLNLLAFEAAKRLGFERPAVGIRAVQPVFGFLFVLAVLLSARRSRAPAELKVIALAAVFTSASMELFFGYMETYTPLLLCSLLYIVSAHRALGGSGGLLVPAACALLSAVFHIEGLLLLPSLLLLVLWRLAGKRRDEIVGPASAALAAAATIGVLSFRTVPSTSKYMLPFSSTERLPGVFSAGHWIDILNEMMLVVPMGLFLAAAAVSARLGRSEAPRKTRAAHRADVAFAWVVFVPSVLFIILFRPALGMARDWDLLALPMMGTLPLLLAATRRFVEGVDASVVLERFAPPAIAMATAVFVLWVGINASATRSVQRFERILSLDPPMAEYGYEMLAMHYRERDQFDEEIAALEKAFAASPNPRYLARMANSHFDAGDTLRALELLRQGVELKPDFEVARDVYVKILALRRDIDEVIRFCRWGIERLPDDWFYHFHLGAAYLSVNMLDEAEVSLSRARGLDPPPPVARAIETFSEKIHQERERKTQ